MSFKEGKFYAIQAQNTDGRWMYLECIAPDHSARLREIARRTTGKKSQYGYTSGYRDDMEDIDLPVESKIKYDTNPFSVKLFKESEVKDMIRDMRMIRKNGGAYNLDSNTIRIVVIETAVQSYVPEEQSQEEIELRKFALEKLSPQEKELLKVSHWEVYHKLGDRSMLDDDTENG